MRLRELPIVAVACGVLLASCAAFDTAAAVVDGTRIDDERFGHIVEFVLADPRFAEQLQQPGQLDRARRDVVRQMLTFLIQNEVVEARAAEGGIDVSGDEVQELLEGQIEQLGGEEAFRMQVRDSGATLEEVRGLLRAQVLRDKVAQAVVEEQVDEAALRAEYEERLAEFTDVTASHILVETQAEAEDLLARATPENFAALARRFSQDPGSAEQGGDLGENPATDFVEPFAEAVLEIEVGAIGGPVETDFGFHVVFVRDRQAIPFETVRDRLIDERSGQVFLEWLLERMRRADIRVNPRYGNFDSESGQVVERTATTPLPGPQVTP